MWGSPWSPSPPRLKPHVLPLADVPFPPLPPPIRAPYRRPARLPFHPLPNPLPFKPPQAVPTTPPSPCAPEYSPSP
eukprot:scaffold16002_cov92-Isochrysis_galbana.AAC.3